MPQKPNQAVGRPHRPGQWFSKRGPWSSNSSSWGPIWNTEMQVISQKFWGWGPAIQVLARPLGNSDAWSSSFRTTASARYFDWLPFAALHKRTVEMWSAGTSSQLFRDPYYPSVCFAITLIRLEHTPIRQNMNQTCSTELGSQFSLALPLVIFFF